MRLQIAAIFLIRHTNELQKPSSFYAIDMNNIALSVRELCTRGKEDFFAYLCCPLLLACDIMYFPQEMTRQ
jgi:hypothetical protein